jgi:hypothetical protein
MSNMFVNSAAIAFIYFIVKFIEMRFFDKENKPLKFLVKDTFIVYISSVFAFFVLDQLKPILEDGNKIISPQIFTSNPDF